MTEALQACILNMFTNHDHWQAIFSRTFQSSYVRVPIKVKVFIASLSPSMPPLSVSLCVSLSLSYLFCLFRFLFMFLTNSLPHTQHSPLSTGEVFNVCPSSNLPFEFAIRISIFHITTFKSLCGPC